MTPNYEAARKAFDDTARYWAPELLRSEAHIDQLCNAIADAACAEPVNDSATIEFFDRYLEQTGDHTR